MASDSIGLPPYRRGWYDYSECFGKKVERLSNNPPAWKGDSSSARILSDSIDDINWWEIPDFDVCMGDVKIIWEASRFDWVFPCAQRMRSGDVEAHTRLEDWLNNWCELNPPYKGPNWKCGQEAAIRVLHLCMVALLLNQTASPTAGIVNLIRIHLQRIIPTMSYAIAQDNNHATSEAAAVFIGGAWLAGQGSADGERWARLGREKFEKSIRRLVAKDGSFSQYSLNYHRVMLDTAIMVELWIRMHSLKPLSLPVLDRLRLATTWLRSLVNPDNGDGPNFGANDGARLFALTDTAYRDYRPSVQTAAVLFFGAKAYAKQDLYDVPLNWYQINIPDQVLDDIGSCVFNEGGIAVLQAGSLRALFRYPRFNFRPGQSDLLHVDLWQAEVNLLRDGGSFSYSADDELIEYFSGSASHNTVQFDHRDQMPRLGRFLYGDWSETSCMKSNIDFFNVETDLQFISAGYQDSYSCSHIRKVELACDKLIVKDDISGFRKSAVLRWRLSPGNWLVDGLTVRLDSHELSISAGMRVDRFEIVVGWESRFYSSKTPLPVLEVEVSEPGYILSEYKLDTQ